MKSYMIFSVIVLLLLSGCTQQQNFLSDYSADSDPDYAFERLQQDLDSLLANNMKIGADHYQALEEVYTSLKEHGLDVTGLREKMDQLSVAVDTSTGDNDQNDQTGDDDTGDDDTGDDDTDDNYVESCTDEPIMFDNTPADMDGVSFIIPMGSVHGDHVSPTDHQYYTSQENAVVDVYSPGDGTVIKISHMGAFRADRFMMDDYHVIIQHTCGMSSVFIHVDDLSEKLAAVGPTETGGHVYVDVPVEAGEIIGTYSGGLDYNVVDESVSINLINPDSYGYTYNHRLHITDPFNYFNEPVKSELIEKSLRSEEPLGGTIDYDVDGTLAGVWFLKDSGGWESFADPNSKYWSGHLAIVYHHVDTEHIAISFGTYDDPENEGKQFGVKGNSPDPVEINTETGIVKYELVEYNYYVNDQLWDGNTFVKNPDVRNSDIVTDVVLFQLIDDTTLKVELFIGKTGSQVDEFTDNADIYVR
ncbi:M23 family metallopeptidase [Candidatus Aenigmatarchaeota archaeon]